MEFKDFPRKLTRDATDRLLIQAADDSVRHIEAGDFVSGLGSPTIGSKYHLFATRDFISALPSGGVRMSLTFPTVVTQVNGTGYNTSTGVFVAERAGWYFFEFSILNRGNTFLYGEVLAPSYEKAFYTTSNGTLCQGSGIVFLAASQSLIFRALANSGGGRFGDVPSHSNLTIHEL